MANIDLDPSWAVVTDTGSRKVYFFNVTQICTDKGLTINIGDNVQMSPAVPTGLYTKAAVVKRTDTSNLDLVSVFMNPVSSMTNVLWGIYSSLSSGRSYSASVTGPNDCVTAAVTAPFTSWRITKQTAVPASFYVTFTLYEPIA